jgi:two-component system, response regulator YesN
MYRLLIVDDEEEIRRGLTDFFPWNEIGFEVVGGLENGKLALDRMESGGVDAVFCDIRMPIMSGIELARAASVSHPEIPVVFLSAYKDFAYARKAIQYDVRDYVLKPTSYDEIRTVFSRLKEELDRRHVPEPAAPFASVPDAFISTIRAYIEREYHHATLKGAARVAHLNPQYVSRLFSEKTGEHFHDYLTRIRMEQAGRLLRDPQYCTYEVSEIVGYSNPKNFSRTFKRQFGVSPREYRHRA